MFKQKDQSELVKLTRNNGWDKLYGVSYMISLRRVPKLTLVSTDLEHESPFAAHLTTLSPAKCRHWGKVAERQASVHAPSVRNQSLEDMTAAHSQANSGKQASIV